MARGHNLLDNYRSCVVDNNTKYQRWSGTKQVKGTLSLQDIEKLSWNRGSCSSKVPEGSMEATGIELPLTVFLDCGFVVLYCWSASQDVPTTAGIVPSMAGLRVTNYFIIVFMVHSPETHTCVVLETWTLVGKLLLFIAKWT